MARAQGDAQKQTPDLRATVKHVFGKDLEDLKATGFRPEVNAELRLESAMKAIRDYFGLLNEWENEFKEHYGVNSQEYKNLVEQNKAVREQLADDQRDLDNPATVERAITVYEKTVQDYRGHYLDGNGQLQQNWKPREPGII